MPHFLGFLFDCFFNNLGTAIRFLLGKVVVNSVHHVVDCSVCKCSLACIPEDTGNPVACVHRMQQEQYDKEVSFI